MPIIFTLNGVATRRISTVALTHLSVSRPCVAHKTVFSSACSSSTLTCEAGVKKYK